MSILKRCISSTEGIQHAKTAECFSQVGGQGPLWATDDHHEKMGFSSSQSQRDCRNFILHGLYFKSNN